jgi:hypothetical protein
MMLAFSASRFSRPQLPKNKTPGKIFGGRKNFAYPKHPALSDGPVCCSLQQKGASFIG